MPGLRAGGWLVVAGCAALLLLFFAVQPVSTRLLGSSSEDVLRCVRRCCSTGPLAAVGHCSTCLILCEALSASKQSSRCPPLLSLSPPLTSNGSAG